MTDPLERALRARLRAATQALREARKAMTVALDALESDADVDARRNAFELLQEQFEGVVEDDE